MATTNAHSNDIYAALLAGKAMTALARLADNPNAWDSDLAGGIRDGIKFCNDLASSLPEEAENTGNAEFDSVLKRLTAQTVATHQLVEPDEISSLITFLCEIRDRRAEPNVERLGSAIAFFVKASSGHKIKVMIEPTLFEM